MKKCAYCGRENHDDAERCHECGTEFTAKRTPERLSPADEERLQRICVLDNEAQAGLLDTLLTEQGIPHILQSYHDSAYDGLFQTQKGWGIILAPARFSDEILTALRDIKLQSSP